MLDGSVCARCICIMCARTSYHVQCCSDPNFVSHSGSLTEPCPLMRTTAVHQCGWLEFPPVSGPPRIVLVHICLSFCAADLFATAGHLFVCFSCLSCWSVRVCRDICAHAYEASDEEIDDEVLTSPELPPNKFTPAPLATTGSPSDPTAATGTTGAPDTPTGESATDMPLITEIAQGKDVSFVRVPTAQPMQLRADLPMPQGSPKAIVPMCGIWNDLVDVDVDATQSQAVIL